MTPRISSIETIRPTHSSTVNRPVSRRRAGSEEASYGADTPGELCDLSRPGLPIEPLRIAFLTGGDIGRQVDLEETALGQELAHGLPVGPVGRDEGRQGDEAGIGEQGGHMPHPAGCSPFGPPVKIRDRH